MNKDDRKTAILNYTKGETYVTKGASGKRILYRGEIKEFQIYEIPMDLLILNVENGRIASHVKSFEKEIGPLHPEKEDDAVTLSKFIYLSHPSSNNRTRSDLAKNGQLEPGIITSDGIIVDGNRRFSLMWDIAHSPKSTPDEKARCQVFRTIVLPEDADEKEILRLETSFQMGVDEKVGYNPIEKYLHAQDMKDRGFSIEDIAEYMGEKTSEITMYLEVKKLIDDYLDWCDCAGIYTQLPQGFEDDLQKLNHVCKKIRKGGIPWIPADRIDEVENDLKAMSFDYIRLNMKSEDGFEFRSISYSANNNFLINEDVWNQIVEDWKASTSDIDEDPIDVVLNRSQGINDTKRLLEARDNSWREQVREKLKEAFATASNATENKKEKNKPYQLIKKAANALREVDLDSISSIKNLEEVKDQIDEIQNIVAKIAQRITL